MATRKAASLPVGFLSGFEPWTTLWSGQTAIYPSEQSARWAVRKLAPELAKAEAVAMHRRSLMVHPQRFAEVAERDALAQFQARVSGK